MNKSTLPLILAIFFLFQSCEKKQHNKTEFNVNGISDVKIAANGSQTLPLTIQHVSGAQENVSLSLNGVPSKTSAEFSTASGIPTFSSTLTIDAKMEKEGTYPLTITATSTSGIKKDFSFNLLVDKPTNCAATLVGTYGGSRQCSNGSGYPEHATIVVATGLDVNTITLNGDYNFSNDIADLGCSAGTITLRPRTWEQYGNTYKTTGSGSFMSPNVINLNITRSVISNGQEHVLSTCAYTLAK